MSYRDDQAAAQRRIEHLEDELARAQAAQRRIGHLEDELARAQAEITTLRAREPSSPPVRAPGEPEAFNLEAELKPMGSLAPREPAAFDLEAERERIRQRIFNPNGLSEQELRRRRLTCYAGLVGMVLTVLLALPLAALGVPFSWVMGVSTVLFIPALIAFLRGS